MNNRRSEIATLFVIGTMVVIGVTAVISSFSLNQKRSTSSRASGFTCQTNGHTCVFRDGDTQTASLFCTSNSFVGSGTGTCPTNNVCCRTVPATPKPTNTPIPTCKKTKCLGSSNEYYVNAGKFWEDPICKMEPISNLSDYCKAPSQPSPANNATPVPSNGKGCGSGAQWACEASKGYDPVSCPTKNLEFRCCVQRSNGDLVVHSCGGRYCSDINLAGITACSTQAGYGAGAPGSIITKPGQTNPSEPPAGGGGGGGAGSTDPNCKAGSGNKFACDPAAGYNKSVCEAPNLEFACCVQDSRCPNGENRYRWFGCTGQPCQNTKIKNALGHLVACPYGVDRNNQESCESGLPPTPTFPPTEEPVEPEVEPTMPLFGEMGECLPVTCPAGTAGGPYYQMLKQKGSHASGNKYYESLSECNKGKTSSSYGSFVKTTIQNKVCVEDDGRRPDSTISPKPPDAFSTLTPIPVSSYTEDQRIKAYCRTNNNGAIYCAGSKKYSKYIGGIKYCCDFDPSDDKAFNQWVSKNPTPTTHNVPGGGAAAGNFNLNDYTCTGNVTDQCTKSIAKACWSLFGNGQYVSCKKNNDSIYQGFCCPTEAQINSQNAINIQVFNQCTYDVKLTAGGKSDIAEAGTDAYIRLDMREVDEKKLILKFINVKSGDMRMMTIDASSGYYFVDVTGPGCP